MQLKRQAALILWCFSLVTGGVFAAPDEAILGKAEGYPLCWGVQRLQARCLVGTFSRMDEIYPARKVFRGGQNWSLRRANPEPPLLYKTSFGSSTLDEHLEQNRTTGLLVMKGDTILFERYQYERKPEQRMLSDSMAKTIVTMLLGVALHEGKIKSLDDPAEAYVPELKGYPYGATALRHLLSMSSGVRFAENHRGKDDMAMLARLSILQESEGGVATVIPFRDRANLPGEKFNYASAETQVLGLVLRAATGATLSDYASEKLWQPMGAEADASWNIDKGGYEVAFSYFNATLRDYARFGLLMANDGARDGKQIIPADWVREATTVSARQSQSGQMHQGWGGHQVKLIPGNGRRFAMAGAYGQFVCVDPKSKVVVVHTAAIGAQDKQSFYKDTTMCSGIMDHLAN